MAPDVGFEPTTKRLTAAYSTAELIRNKSSLKMKRDYITIKILCQEILHKFC